MGILVGIGIQGCVAKHGLSIPEGPTQTHTTMVGKVQVILTGPSNRWFEPHLEFAELYNRKTKERVRLDFQTQQAVFLFSIPDGDYELVRVQVGEGAFRSMAQVVGAFSIKPNRLNYVGTWTLEVASPFYDRKIQVRFSSEMENTLSQFRGQYPEYPLNTLEQSLPAPHTQNTRLFEVMPYPRVKYFRRHPAT